MSVRDHFKVDRSRPGVVVITTLKGELVSRFYPKHYDVAGIEDMIEDQIIRVCETYLREHPELISPCKEHQRVYAKDGLRWICRSCGVEGTDEAPPDPYEELKLLKRNGFFARF